MSNKPSNALPEWTALQELQAGLHSAHIKDLFDKDPERFNRFSVSINGLLFDYSKHMITDAVQDALVALAKAKGLEDARDQMFAGAPLNETENRAVLHVALRGSCDPSVEVDGENVCDFVHDTLARMKDLSDDIRADKKIKTVVNLGIGGSDLGPRMAYKALKPYKDGPKTYFISNIDASGLHFRLNDLDAKSTLFVISSKSFKTQETYENAKAAREWLLKSIDEAELPRHLVAVSNNVDAATAFGIEHDRILPMRDWIGGRYSVWSAIGLPLAIAYGFEKFQAFLDGARTMDAHFKTAPLSDNIPFLMGALGVWYRNFWDYPAHALLPYSHDLRDLPTYMQQVDMESNGKSVTRDGEPLPYDAGPIVFGESGTNSQHTFMQLLHQSNEIVPADIIAFVNTWHPYKAHHEKLLGHALAQGKSLMEGAPPSYEPYKNYPGNRPSSTLVFDILDFHHLGMLMALYEHKIFVQGILWGINSFDQWGVELGKSNAEKIIEHIEKQQKTKNYDSSTAGLISYLHQKFIKS